MRKSINFRRQILLVSFGSVLLSMACNDSPNSKVGILARNSPTPAPVAVAEAVVTPSLQPAPGNSPAPEISSSPMTVPSPTIQPEEADPFVNSSENKSNESNGETAVVTPSDKLMIPVMGIRREDLRDTFDAARSEGRVHDAIDIMAAGGTPVVAATDGKIVKFFDSARGGITIYQLSPDEHTVYYYAHLQRRADNLREDETVKQGTLLGYVGDTGNSGTGNYHLHFAIWTITDPKRFYEGANINPYPVLKDGIVKSQ